MRRIDELGRVVIPSELREKYGLVHGTGVDFLDRDGEIVIKPSLPLCRVCHEKIPTDSAFPLCQSCIATAARIYETGRA